MKLSVIYLVYFDWEFGDRVCEWEFDNDLVFCLVSRFSFGNVVQRLGSFEQPWMMVKIRICLVVRYSYRILSIY